jgi:hypothetical protein
VLRSDLSLLNKLKEVSLALSKPSNDRFLWELREVVVLHDEVMQIVAQVVCTRSAAMPVEHPEEADLRPLAIEVLLLFRL